MEFMCSSKVRVRDVQEEFQDWAVSKNAYGDPQQWQAVRVCCLPQFFQPQGQAQAPSAHPRPSQTLQMSAQKLYWYSILQLLLLLVPSVLWRCWLSGRKGIQPVKTEWWGTGVVICLERGADGLHMVQLIHHPVISCCSKIPEWFTCLVPAYAGCPGKKPVNGCTSSVVTTATTTCAICRWRVFCAFITKVNQGIFYCM